MGVAIGFGCLVWVGITHKGIVTKFLSCNLFFPVAKTSYAIYLIHIPIIHYILELKGPYLFSLDPTLGLLVTFVIVIIISVFISSLLYILIEKPFMKIRKNILGKIN
jgi:peptidoglycan/LPS O-acetylase OafA/YrhL